MNNDEVEYYPKLWEYQDILKKAGEPFESSSIRECFFDFSPGRFTPPLEEYHLVADFPVLKGTPYAKESYQLVTPLQVQVLGELSKFPWLGNDYEKKVDYMISLPLTKDMFEGHSLFLLKEHCKLFSSYNDKLKTLLAKLEQIDDTDNSENEISMEIQKQPPKTLKQIEEVTFHLQRFINAQDYGGINDNTSTYAQALEEIKAGCKKTHWIWYIFPQMKGLGHSRNSEYYGISGRDEAFAYMDNPILSSRLIEATEAVLNNKHTVYEIFGSDTIKFRSCMLLFSTISDNPIFKQVIHKYHW